MTDAPVTPLPWDTAFFGRRIGRIASGRLTDDRLAAIDAACRAEPYECLYFLADASDAETAALAARRRFLLVDVRVTLDRPLNDAPIMPPDIRPARPTDVPLLREIASASFRDSRFYHDPHFDPARVDEMFALWVEGAVAGRSDVVLVTDNGDGATGFTTVELDGTIGAIGLIGVHESARAIGIGRRLTEAALAYCAAHGANRVDVVTQARNIPAQRLYQACGFRTRAVDLSYHHWITR